MGIPAALNRQALVRLGQRLEYFTVVWNGLEALVSIVAGIIAGSVALVGFGLDSVIEMASGLVLLWRLHHDLDPSRAYLSAILLGGLLLNAVLGWWWADPVAGLLMVPIIAREGVNGLKGNACCDNCGGT